MKRSKEKSEGREKSELIEIAKYVAGQFVRAAKVKKKIRYGKQFAKMEYTMKIDSRSKRLCIRYFISTLNFTAFNWPIEFHWNSNRHTTNCCFVFFSSPYFFFSPFWQLSNCVTVKAPNNLSARNIPFNEYCAVCIRYKWCVEWRIYSITQPIMNIWRREEKKTGLRTAWEKENVLLLDEGVNWIAYEIEERRIRNIYGNLKSKWLCFLSIIRFKICHSIFALSSIVHRCSNWLKLILQTGLQLRRFACSQMHRIMQKIKINEFLIKLPIKLIRLLIYYRSTWMFVLIPSAHWFTKWNVSERESRMKYLYVIDIWIRCYWIFSDKISFNKVNIVSHNF